MYRISVAFACLWAVLALASLPPDLPHFKHARADGIAVPSAAPTTAGSAAEFSYPPVSAGGGGHLAFDTNTSNCPQGGANPVTLSTTLVTNDTMVPNTFGNVTCVSGPGAPKNSGNLYFEIGNPKGTLSQFAQACLFISGWTAITTNVCNGAASSVVAIDSRASASGGGGSFSCTSLLITPSWGGSTNDVIAFAINFSQGSIWVAKNNIYTTYSTGAAPTTGAGGNPACTFTPGTSLFPGVGNKGITLGDTLQIAGSSTSLNGFGPPTSSGTFTWWSP